MKKVKVQRYVSGKRPDYAPASSDEEEEEEEDFTRPQRGGPPSPPQHKSLTEAEMADPRLRRLLAQRAQTEESDEEMETDAPRRRVAHQAEVVDLSEGEEEEEIKQEEEEQIEEVEEGEDEEDLGPMPELRASHRLAESDSESEDEVDEDELALRRHNLRQRALMKVQQQEEVSGKEKINVPEL